MDRFSSFESINEVNGENSQFVSSIGQEEAHSSAVLIELLYLSISKDFCLNLWEEDSPILKV